MIKGPREVFTELYVTDMDFSIQIFTDALGLTLHRLEGDFAELHNGDSRLLLNSQPIDRFDERNPIRTIPSGSPRGAGVELCVAVPDLSSAFKKINQTDGLSIVAKPRERSWGNNDFRFLHPDGFYVRVTD